MTTNQTTYLDRRHLSVTSPAETLKFERVVPETDWPTVEHGPILYLKLQMVKVWKVVVWFWSIPQGKGTQRLNTVKGHFSKIYT